MGIAAMSHMYHVETVPFTNRAHLVCSRRPTHEATEFHFAGFKKERASTILSVDHESTVRVNRILSKIVGAINNPELASRTREPLGWAEELDWEVVVLRDDSVSASCWGSRGKIVVSTELLDRFNTDEEIATILAHEVGHVTARHTSEMIQSLVRRRWFPSFLLSPLFRRHELEADYIGMMLLAACGFDPHAAPRTLEKLEKMKRKYIFNNILYLLIVSTHPSPKKRAQCLSRTKVMDEAMEIYTQVTGAGLDSNKTELLDLEL